MSGGIFSIVLVFIHINMIVITIITIIIVNMKLRYNYNEKNFYSTLHNLRNEHGWGAFFTKAKTTLKALTNCQVMTMMAMSMDGAILKHHEPGQNPMLTQQAELTLG